jgi:hypothetical protein
MSVQVAQTFFIIIIISFMQGIHTYIPETNHVSRVYSVAAIPRVLLMVHILGGGGAMLCLHKCSLKVHSYVIQLYALKVTGTVLVRSEVQGKQIFLSLFCDLLLTGILF